MTSLTIVVFNCFASNLQRSPYTLPYLHGHTESDTLRDLNAILEMDEQNGQSDELGGELFRRKSRGEVSQSRCQLTCLQSHLRWLQTGINGTWKFCLCKTFQGSKVLSESGGLRSKKVTYRHLARKDYQMQFSWVSESE